jgi:hypothetical protein
LLFDNPPAEWPREEVLAASEAVLAMAGGNAELAYHRQLPSGVGRHGSAAPPARRIFDRNQP